METFKEGDEIHAVQVDGVGLMVSAELHEKLKALPESEEVAEYRGVKVVTTPYLPYIYYEPPEIEEC